MKQPFNRDIHTDGKKSSKGEEKMCYCEEMSREICRWKWNAWMNKTNKCRQNVYIYCIALSLLAWGNAWSNDMRKILHTHQIAQHTLAMCSINIPSEKDEWSWMRERKIRNAKINDAVYYGRGTEREADRDEEDNSTFLRRRRGASNRKLQKAFMERSWNRWIE